MVRGNICVVIVFDFNRLFVFRFQTKNISHVLTQSTGCDTVCILHKHNEGDPPCVSGMCIIANFYRVNGFFVPTTGMILLHLSPRLQWRTKSIRIQRVQTL